MSVAELAKRIGIKNDSQIRQWQHGYEGRKPGAKNCVAIERVTACAVTRKDLRPDDWPDIWPELVNSEANHAAAPAQQAQAAIKPVANKTQEA